MARQRICVTFNESESIILPDALKASEIEMVRDWTGLPNRGAWFDAIAEENVDALKAALLLLRKRKGDNTSRFADIDFDFDGVDAYFIDETGRQIEPDIIYDDEGDPVIDVAKGRVKVHRHPDNTARWIYTDTREVVPTTAATPTKSETAASAS